MLGAGQANLQVGVVLVDDWPLDAELVTRDTGVTPVGAVAAATKPDSASILADFSCCCACSPCKHSLGNVRQRWGGGGGGAYSFQ